METASVAVVGGSYVSFSLQGSVLLLQISWHETP